MCWKNSRQKDSFLSVKYEHTGDEEVAQWIHACYAGMRTGGQSPEPMSKHLSVVAHTWNLSRKADPRNSLGSGASQPDLLDEFQTSEIPAQRVHGS